MTDYKPISLKYEILKTVAFYGGQSLPTLVDRVAKNSIGFDDLGLIEQTIKELHTQKKILELVGHDGETFYSLSPKELINMSWL